MVTIDPWASTQYSDYARLRDEFGIKEFDPSFLTGLHQQDPDTYPAPQKLFRRGVIFGHRGFESIAWAIRNKRPWTVLTGLMPSGRMHTGNKMVVLERTIEALISRGALSDHDREIVVAAVDAVPEWFVSAT